MKLSILFGAAYASSPTQCYDTMYAVYKASPSQPLNHELVSETVMNYASCVERETSVDISPIFKAPPQDGSCIKYFLNACYECTKIQSGHPFCVEGNPNYNPIMCAIKLNICFVEELTGIFDVCN